MTSLNFLKELFHFHAHRTFIRTDDRKISFHDFARNFETTNATWISESDPIHFLQQLFGSVFNGQVPILANSYWTETQVKEAKHIATGLSCSTPSIGVFTSGSTHLPKLAIIPIDSFIKSARSSNENISFEDGDSWLLNLPLFHVGGLGIVFRSLLSGGAIYISNRRINTLLEKKNHITHLSLVPTQFFRFLNSELGSEHSLKSILVGGGAIAESLISKAVDFNLPIVKSYGMTETASQIVATQVGASRTDLSTSGRPLSGNSISFEPNTHRILISSHSKMLGYWRDGALDPNLNGSGLLMTNDYGHMENGNLVVEGRIDRIFKCGGENIQPEVIERVLLRHPDVLSAQVLAEANQEYGFVPIAYIQTTEPELTPLLRESIQAHIIENLNGFYRPKQIFNMADLKGSIGLKSHL